MTENNHTPQGLTLVEIEIAKDHHDVFIEPPAPARRCRLRFANQREDFEHFASCLRGLKSTVLIGCEATGNYHRPLAYFLHCQGFALRLIPTLALATLGLMQRPQNLLFAARFLRHSSVLLVPSEDRQQSRLLNLPLAYFAGFGSGLSWSLSDRRMESAWVTQRKPRRLRRNL
jgi:transposase